MGKEFSIDPRTVPHVETKYRRIATPLLWAAFFAESLTYMTLTAWIAVIVEQAGLLPVQASMTFTYAYIGATIAIFVLARFIDAFGPRVSVVSAAIAMALTVWVAGLALGPQMSVKLVLAAQIALGALVYPLYLAVLAPAALGRAIDAYRHWRGLRAVPPTPRYRSPGRDFKQVDVAAT